METSPTPDYNPEQDPDTDAPVTGHDSTTDDQAEGEDLERDPRVTSPSVRQDLNAEKQGDQVEGDDSAA